MRFTPVCTLGAIMLLGVTVTATADWKCPELLRQITPHIRNHEQTTHQTAVADAVNRMWPGSPASCKALQQRQQARRRVSSILDQIADGSCLSPMMVSSYRHLLVLEEEKRERRWCPGS